MEPSSTFLSSVSGQTFTFPLTEVIISPPAHDAPRPVLRGMLDGTWTTQPTSETTFRVTALNALLTLPIDIEDSIDPAPPRTAPVWLSLAEFVPPAPHNCCHALNHGTFDPHNRLAAATLGLRARLPFNAGNTESSLLVMQTMAAFGRHGLQTGSGVGTAIRGWLLGTIFCCAAGPRGQLKRDSKLADESPRPMGAGSHLEIDLQIAVTGEPTTDAKKLTSRPDKLVQILVRQVLRLFQRAGILDELAQQLSKDGLGPIKVSIVIRMDNKLHDGHPPISALTTCGDNGFVGIEIDASTLLEPYADDIMESFWDTLAHELLHAKNCAYEKASRPLPYGGHDDNRFKKKVKEFVDKAKERARKDQEAWEKAFKDAFGK